MTVLGAGMSDVHHVVPLGEIRFRQRFQAWKIGLKICLEKDKFYPGYREVFSVRMTFLGSNL